MRSSFTCRPWRTGVACGAIRRLGASGAPFVARRRSPRAERTRGTAGEPEPLDGQERRTSDHFFIWVVAALWCSSRRCAASLGVASRAVWAHSSISISGAAAMDERMYLAAATIGVIRVRSPSGPGQPALSNSGAASQPRWRASRPAYVRRVGRRERHRSFRPSCRASSSSGPSLGRRRAALGVIRNAVVLASVSSGTGSFEGPSNTALEPSRPTVGCYSVAAARGSARAVGPTNENQGIRINSDKEQIASGSSAHRGYARRNRRPIRAKSSLGRRRAVECLVGGRGSSRHRTVGETKSRNRASGLFAHVGVRLRTSGHSRTAARQWRHWQVLGTVDAAGLATAGASIHSSVSITRSPGSSRTACWGHRNRPRQPVASPARRLAGHPKRRSLFAQSRAWLIRIFGSPGPFAENGRSASRVTARVSSPLGVTTRRSVGHSCVVALSSVSVSRTHWKAGPTRKWSRRARPSCAILSLRRAAHLQR